MTRRTIANGSSSRPDARAEEAEAALEAMTPLGRLLEPDEVAAAVVFLASPEAAAINGQRSCSTAGDPGMSPFRASAGFTEPWQNFDFSLDTASRRSRSRDRRS